MLHCKSIQEHKDINEFVSFVCWFTPGLNILYDKNMKRKSKLEKLIIDTGYFGPLMDVVIRGTVNHMLVLNYAEDTKAITNSNSGFLKQFLLVHFKTNDLSETISAWMKNKVCNLDYENLYRHKRSEIIISQIRFLTQNPRNFVSNCLISFCASYFDI